MDSSAVEVLTLRGLVRYFVLIVIRLKSRQVEVAGIVHHPYGHSMVQVARNLTDVDFGFLREGYYVIHDRDPVYTAELCSVLESVGVTPIRLPPKSPNLNACAERFVRSTKEECLDRIVPLGEKHLRDVAGEYIVHYHAERNHQGLGNRLVAPAAEIKRLQGAVRRRERVGALLNYYYYYYYYYYYRDAA
jgi:putative transposase